MKVTLAYSNICHHLFKVSSVSNQEYVMKNHERLIKRQRTDHEVLGLDFISSIPDDCLRHVFSFLPSKKDRLACSAVSKRWFNLQLQIVSIKLRKYDHPTTSREVSRKLVGPHFTNLTLAAMLVSIDHEEILTSFALDGHSQSFQSKGCQITDAGISMLTGLCTRLMAVSLKNCTMIGNIGIACIAYNCNLLQWIELTNSWLVTDKGLTLLIMKCTSLSILRLDTCLNISDHSLEAIARYSTNLKSLELVNLPLVDGCGVTTILRNRIHLKTFKINSINLSDKALSTFPQKWSLSELKNVSVQNPGHELTEKGLVRLTSFARRMENLYLEGFKFAISFSSLMQILANCHHTIKSLELIRCNTCKSNTSLSYFRPDKHNFPKLQKVKLQQCRNMVDSFLFKLGQGCQLIKEINLVELDFITNRGITGFLQNLHHANKIRKIEVTHCAKFGNPSVWAITRTCGSKLKSLIIKDCELVTDRGVSVIGSRCPQLINLDLGGTRVGDAGVKQIVDARLFHLEELSLRGCTEITDASLVAIANASFLISLERVGLSGCTGLSKEGLELLKSMSYELI